MNYKGYVGVVEYDDEAKIFSGEVINTRTVITFQGTTVDELENEFHASVDDYLEWCKEDGIEPEKPYSGKFNVRISPLFHSQIAVAKMPLKNEVCPHFMHTLLWCKNFLMEKSAELCYN